MIPAALLAWGSALGCKIKRIKRLQHLAAMLRKGGGRHIAPHSGAVAGSQQQLDYAQRCLLIPCRCIGRLLLQEQDKDWAAA